MKILHRLIFKDGFIIEYSNNKKYWILLAPGETFWPITLYDKIEERRLECTYKQWIARWGK